MADDLALFALVGFSYDGMTISESNLVTPLAGVESCPDSKNFPTIAGASNVQRIIAISRIDLIDR